MAFEVVIPNWFVRPGEAAIWNLTAYLARADLEAAGITDGAVVLIDRTQRRLGLRQTRTSGEAVSASTGKRRKAATQDVAEPVSRILVDEQGIGRISLDGMLAGLGGALSLNGRYAVRHEAGVLVIELGKR